MKFFNILNKNVKDKFIKTTIHKNTGSFCELLFENVLPYQSINIKMGYVMENTWKQFLSTINGVEVINIKKINNIQIDLLFRYNKSLYYFEIKNNINLDTEKTRCIFNKLDVVKQYLIRKFNTDNVYCYVLNNRYNTSEEIKNIKSPLTKDIVFGYNDLFNIFGYSVNGSLWKTEMNKIGELIKGLI